VDAVIEDWRTAPVDPPLRAMLGFLEKLTLTPSELTAADADAVRAAGVTDEAIEDAIHVCASFVLINKLADAFGWALLDEAVYDKRGAMALERGYAIPPPALG
jgi:alkylhydroperoxidase family enzyme